MDKYAKKIAEKTEQILSAKHDLASVVESLFIKIYRANARMFHACYEMTHSWTFNIVPNEAAVDEHNPSYIKWKNASIKWHNGLVHYMVDDDDYCFAMKNGIAHLHIDNKCVPVCAAPSPMSLCEIEAACLAMSSISHNDISNAITEQFQFQSS